MNQFAVSWITVALLAVLFLGLVLARKLGLVGIETALVALLTAFLGALSPQLLKDTHKPAPAPEKKDES